MTPAEARAELGNAGDKIAEMLGYCVAALEGGEGLAPHQIEAAQRAIPLWHVIRGLAKTDAE